MVGCPGLPSIITDITWGIELGSDKSKSELLELGIDSLFFNCEINPFNGKPFFNEIVFFHVKSKTLFMSDTFWNYPASNIPNYSDNSDSGYQHLCPKVETPKLVNNKLPSVSVPIGTKLWKFGMDKIYLPFYKNIMIKDKDKYNQIVNKLLSWDIEVICPCHGDVIRGKQKCIEVLQNHFF